MSLDTLRERLRRLDVLLRREGYARGPDVWQSIYDLLLRLDAQGNLPATEDLGPLLGPLICRSPDEQQRFPQLVAEWATGKPPPPPEPNVDTLRRPALLQWWSELRRYDRRWRIVGAVALATLVALATVMLTQVPDGQGGPVQPQSRPAVQNVDTPAPNVSSKIPIVNTVPPNRLPQPEVLPPAWQRTSAWLGYSVVSLPGLWAAWLLTRYYTRRMRLEKRSADQTPASTRLLFSLPVAAIFGSSAARTAITALRPALWERSRRLDVRATVEATAHGAGYFQPRYRNLRRTPVYLVLVRGVDRDDHRAHWAEELSERLRETGIAVRSYRFRDDPRWLKPWGSTRGPDSSLAKLAVDYADARLLVLSETDILFHPITGEAKAWINDFTPWPQRAWLHPRDAGLPHAELLWQHRFLTLPLASASLGSLATWLTTTPQHLPPPHANDSVPLPESLSGDPDAWLAPHPPYGARLDQLMGQLNWYLGTHGMLLMRTIAVYPEPYWNLTLALDYVLFARKDIAVPLRREQRLARISRLPWLRHVHFPLYLREALLRGADKSDLDTVRKTWQTLFSQLTDQAYQGQLKLDIALPPQRQFRHWIRDLARSGQVRALQDRIYANILSGGSLGLFDFRLPRAAERFWRGRSTWREAGRLLLVLALTLGSTYGLHRLWQTTGNDWILDRWRQNLRQDNSRWRVAIQGNEDTKALTALLERRFSADGFQSSFQAATAALGSVNQVVYPKTADGLAAARRLAQRIAHVTYGAYPELLPDPNSQNRSTLTVALANTYQANSVFHDHLPDAGEPGQGVIRDTITDGQAGIMSVPGPAMVPLPGGRFSMGCSAGDSMCEDDEKPAHTVTVKPFAIGRTEVTFADYDSYARATGKPLPHDNGWGRDQRPAIKVSRSDAADYAEWLSARTGQRYRLPSEAEWEYAARAGTVSVYPWGDKATDADPYAWILDNSGSRTHPVAEKRSNAFGLHDMQGNVWEWTADCYHNSYDKAPVDGSAWADSQVTCQPVVRGGSWLYEPQFLRSSYRSRVNRDVAYLDVGFRLARDL